MKNDKYRTYIYWGVTAFAVLSLLTILIFVIINWGKVKTNAGILGRILEPITYGAVFAYLMTPIYNRVRTGVMAATKNVIEAEKPRKSLGAVAATAVSLMVLIAVVTGLISMLIPQLINSVKTIIEALPSSISNLELWIEQLFADNPDMEARVLEQYSAASDYVQNWLTNEALPNIYNILSGLSSGLFNLLNTLKNVLIGLIVMVYLLNMKEKLITQAKMIVYGAFPLRIANKVIEEARYVHLVFGGFIIGKLLDSLIIGLMCFVLLNFMNMPYVLLVSVIIGVTNVVPFFGPFIGAVPSAFLILLVSPMKCLYFIIFIFLLQQFDGNILGPKILGDSTGLSSFWVLFSILLFGGLFGFVGMIIGVPTFAVFYKLITEFISYMLEKRQLSADIEKYEELDHIDEKQKTYISK